LPGAVAAAGDAAVGGETADEGAELPFAHAEATKTTKATDNRERDPRASMKVSTMVPGSAATC
jgi:hypothetical protein